MKQMGVTKWRSELGDLRQGTEVVVVLYRQRPAALLVPIPPAHWGDATPFLDPVIQLRDRHLQPPARERKHDWVTQPHGATKMSIEEARRGSALLFGILTRNTPVILTFYDYDNVLMLPLPPDLSERELQVIHEQTQAYVRSSDTSQFAAGWIK